MAKISIARDDYFKVLGLQQDPFDNSYSTNSYFITPELQHRLELCKHLLEFSQQILLIKGPEKAGKTSFCLHMKDSADIDWVFCHIEASEEIGPDDLVKTLLREHHDMLDDTTETISALNEYLKYCNTQSKVPILVVDKADSLNQDSLRFIFQLMEFKEEDTFVRVVLTGDDSFLVRLNEAAEDKSNSNLIHSVSIPAFSAEQSVQYLQHRLRASEAREDMFSEKEMNRIHKVAAGIAGDLNFLARQGLSDPATLIPEAPESFLTRGKAKKVKQLSILIFSAFLLTVLIFLVSTALRDDKQEQTQTLTVSLPAEAPPLPDTTVPDVTREEPEALPDTSMEEQTVETRIASSNLINEVIGINDRDTEKIEEVAATKKAPVQVSEPEESLNIAPKAEIETSIGPIRGTKWLLSQSPRSYVLQLMGAVEISTISGFLQNAGLDRSKLALYTIKKSNKDWHVLVYGQFADVVTARAEIDLLSEEAQRQKPWPKAISSIHEAIKKH